MELGRIERLSPVVAPVVAECKALVDDMFRTVRNLALGLRPSMLDDFGLRAALEWHARDCMSRYAIDVDLQTEGDLDALPDKYRTCAYRVVQEATTNCVRHAEARKVQIAVSVSGDQLEVRVSDDGRGLDSRQRRRGLGLRGIDERVKELHGAMTLSSAPSGGTTLSVSLPLPMTLSDSEMDVPRARVAG
jgi:signal transduction histidine kinase